MTLSWMLRSESWRQPCWPNFDQMSVVDMQDLNKPHVVVEDVGATYVPIFPKANKF